MHRRNSNLFTSAAVIILLEALVLVFLIGVFS